jgi:hypothetical protein
MRYHLVEQPGGISATDKANLREKLSRFADRVGLILVGTVLLLQSLRR